MIKYLPWDSSFFGFKTGMSVINNPEEVESIKQEFNQSNYKLIYLFDYNTNDIIVELLKEANIPLIDTKLTYSKHRFIKNSHNKSRTVETLSQKLFDLGLQSGVYSRFYRDENLQKFFEPMYTKWIEKSLSGEMADDIIGIYDDTQLCGMLTIKASHDKAQIGLTAVDSKYRGAGIGRSLLQAADNWCLEKKLSELSVATQLINTDACKFYTNNNFKLKNAIHIFHLWK